MKLRIRKWVSVLMIAVLMLSTLAGCATQGSDETPASLQTPSAPTVSAEKPEQKPDSTGASTATPDELPETYNVPDYGGNVGNFSVTIPAGIKVSDNLEIFGSMSIRLHDNTWIMLISTSTQESLKAEEENSSYYGYETRPYNVGGNEALLVIREKSDGTVTVSLNFVTPSGVSQLGLIETSGVTDIDEYLNDPVVKAIISSVDKPVNAGGENGYRGGLVGLVEKEGTLQFCINTNRIEMGDQP